MTVSDRAHDIAVLMAMGARRQQIRRIFVLLGVAVGGLGTALGLFAGYLFAWAAGTYQADPARPADLLGSLRALPSQSQRCLVDCGCGAGDQRRFDARAGAFRVAHPARGYSAI